MIQDDQDKAICWLNLLVHLLLLLFYYCVIFKIRISAHYEKKHQCLPVAEELHDLVKHPSFGPENNKSSELIINQKNHINNH